MAKEWILGMFGRRRAEVEAVVRDTRQVLTREELADLFRVELSGGLVRG